MRKKDNIFEAQQGTYDQDFTETTFEINPMCSGRFEENSLEKVDNMDNRELNAIIEKYMYSEWEEKLKDTSYIFKKYEIQEIYRVIRERTKKHPKVDMIIILCNYLNIEPSKLYAFLGNAYKNELIEELEDKFHIFSKKGYNRLF